jgi:hypothetical protein
MIDVVVMVGRMKQVQGVGHDKGSERLPAHDSNNKINDLGGVKLNHAPIGSTEHRLGFFR